MKTNSPRSLRQEFCQRYRELWIIMVLLVGGFDAYVIWRTTALETFLIGAVVGLLALVYLVLNHPLGLVWRSLPAKELAIGVLFTAGTLVALLPIIPSVTMPFVSSALAFAALCALNCISIADWERELDRAQQKVSVATRHPRLGRSAGKICVFLAFASFALAIEYRTAAPIFICAGASALGLIWLNAWPQADRNDQRTALADLVLLTPIVPLLMMTS